MDTKTPRLFPMNSLSYTWQERRTMLGASRCVCTVYRGFCIFVKGGLPTRVCSVLGLGRRGPRSALRDSSSDGATGTKGRMSGGAGH